MERVVRELTSFVGKDGERKCFQYYINGQIDYMKLPDNWGKTLLSKLEKMKEEMQKEAEELKNV